MNSLLQNSPEKIHMLKIPAEFKQIHNIKSLIYVVANSAVVIFSGVIAYYLSIWWCYILAFIAVAIAGDALLKLQHEAMHGILVSNKKLNAAIGKFISALVGTRFYDAVTIHMRHHSRIGSDEDPNLYWYDVKKNIVFFMLGQLFGAKLWMFISRTVIVLVGSVMPKHLGKLKTNTSLDSAPVVINRSHSVNDLVCLVAVQISLFISISILASPWVYIVFILLPPSTLGSLFESIRSFSEHACYENNNDLITKKSRMYLVSSNPVERIILSQFGFHLHHLHHFYPTIPVFNLPKLHRWLLDHQDTYAEMFVVRKSYIGTLYLYISKRPLE